MSIMGLRKSVLTPAGIDGEHIRRELGNLSRLKDSLIQFYSFQALKFLFSCKIYQMFSLNSCHGH